MRKTLTAIIVYFAVTNRVYAQEPGTWLRLPTTESINTLVTTPFALYGGQYATKSWYGSYNGIYKSTNLGLTWTRLGLMDKGIKDLAYGMGKLFACTYYEEGGTAGIYSSSDEGANWQHLGPNYPCTKLAVFENMVILGTKSNGIWISSDQGITFTQTLLLGSAPESEVVGLNCAGNTCFAGTYAKTYRSSDGGITWNEIPQLVNKVAGYFGIENHFVLAATRYGLYRSTDSGTSWILYTPWGSSQLGSLIFYNHIAYVAKKELNGACQVYQSKDFGLNWESTDMTTATNISPLTGFTWLYTKPAFLYSAGFGSGVQRYAINPKELRITAFLGQLWKDASSTTQLQSVTSYFDHAYPLLGYYLYPEPEAETSSIINFLGEEGTPPKLYYSSHDGYDFGLNYGTKILAPFSGQATYQYSSLGGHTIKIDHQNGYQTAYLHLQKSDLFTTSNEPTHINKGDQVGLVGLTGNTTGPHLHFSVTQDKMGNGSFADDFPDGKTDPYSWQSEATHDPWEIYTWTDSLREHTGTDSSFLWDDQISPSYGYTNQSSVFTLEKSPIKVEIPADSLPNPATIEIHPWTATNFGFFDQHLKPLMNTSFRVAALDQLNRYLPDFAHPVKLVFDLSNEILNNINLATLQVAFFNPSSLLWEFLPSVWNQTEKRLEALANHFSEFVVVGQKIDPDPPETSIVITGQKDGDWYTESPFITLAHNDGSELDKSFYSLDGGVTWDEYLTQTQVIKEGVYAVLYRSVDTFQNFEDAKDSPLLRINTLGLFHDEAALYGASFTIVNPE